MVSYSDVDAAFALNDTNTETLFLSKYSQNIKFCQGRNKGSTGPGAVPNAGPLQTYNQLTG